MGKTIDITEHDEILIYKLGNETSLSYNYIARLFNITNQTVEKIVNRKCDKYKYLENIYVDKKVKRKYSKYNEEISSKIIELYKLGKSMDYIKKNTGMSYNYIYYTIDIFEGKLNYGELDNSTLNDLILTIKSGHYSNKWISNTFNVTRRTIDKLKYKINKQEY